MRVPAAEGKEFVTTVPQVFPSWISVRSIESPERQSRTKYGVVANILLESGGCSVLRYDSRKRVCKLQNRPRVKHMVT